MSISSTVQYDRFVPKYARLKQKLLADIEQLSVGDRLPSIAVIRQRFKVSQPTVDRAIQELRMEGLVESVRGRGMYVTPAAKVKNIGMLFGRDIFQAGTGPFERALLAALQSQCRDNNFLLRFYLDDPTHMRDEHGPDQLEMDVQMERLHGILSTDETQTSWVEKVRRLQLPTVVLSSSSDFPHCVVLNYSSIIRFGVESLAAKGCQRIALFGHGHDGLATMEAAAFRLAIQQTGVKTRPEWYHRWTEVNSLELVGYREFTHLWNSWQEKPDGLVCVDDNVTVGLLRAAKSLGVRIPEVLNVASHANRNSSNFGTASIIRIEFDVNRAAKVMLDSLRTLMAGQPLNSSVMIIEPELVDSLVVNGASGS